MSRVGDPDSGAGFVCLLILVGLPLLSMFWGLVMELIWNMGFLRWPSINHLANVRKSLMKLAELHPDRAYRHPVTYRAKIKLHGTNAAVRHEPDGRIVAQSRSKDLAVGDDNMGFAAWVAANEGAWREALKPGHCAFGEWFGKGVNKGAAACQVEGKHFAVFALATDVDTLVVDPWDIAVLSGKFPPGTRVLPWHVDDLDPWTVQIDWADPAQGARAIATLVERVERKDPWVWRNFGVAGTGEGVVLYPVDTTAVEALSLLMIKAKGDDHKVKATKEKVAVDPEVAASYEAFAAMFATPARLAQCESELGIAEPMLIHTKNVMTWMMSDIKKESQDEQDVAGFKWADVQRTVADHVRRQWRARVEAYDEEY